MKYQIVGKNIVVTDGNKKCVRKETFTHEQIPLSSTMTLTVAAVVVENSLDSEG